MGFGKLYVCPTPIGNLGDITQRTLEVLRRADAICAEDTRVTGRLLAAYDIEKRIERLDEASLGKKMEDILARLIDGETIAYCSDAGMPGVSDPGARLVEASREKGIPVEVLPGASAGVTAYVASGFTNPRFYFGGFFPRKEAEQRALLDSLKKLDAVLIFYESPNRVVAALRSIEVCVPYREVAVCRELTKLHEEVFRAKAPQVFAEFSKRAETASIKGEIVIVIDAPTGEELHAETSSQEEAARARIEELRQDSSLSRKDIVTCIQKEYAISRNVAYDMVMNG